MIRRTFTRLLAGLCLAYLFVVFVFARFLVPTMDEAVASDDYSDDIGPYYSAKEAAIAGDVIGGRKNVTGGEVINDDRASPLRAGEPGGGPVKFHAQLQSLEQGMTKLEQQIADVRSRVLSHELARAQKLQQGATGQKRKKPAESESKAARPAVQQQKMQDQQEEQQQLKMQLDPPQILAPQAHKTEGGVVEVMDKQSETEHEEEEENDGDVSHGHEEEEWNEREEEEEEREDHENEEGYENKEGEAGLNPKQQLKFGEQRRRKEILEEIRRRRHEERMKRMRNGPRGPRNDYYDFEGRARRGRMRQPRPRRPGPWEFNQPGPRKHPGKSLMGQEEPLPEKEAQIVPKKALVVQKEPLPQLDPHAPGQALIRQEALPKLDRKYSEEVLMMSQVEAPPPHADKNAPGKALGKGGLPQTGQNAPGMLPAVEKKKPFPEKDARKDGVKAMEARQKKSGTLPPVPKAPGRDDSPWIELSKSAWVYSAYLDNRLENETYVRLMMIGAGPANQRTVRCHFDFTDTATYSSTDTQQYEMCENHRKLYRGFIYSCPVPLAAGRTPRVTLSLSSPRGARGRVTLPVQYVHHPAPSSSGQQGLAAKDLGSTKPGRFQYSYSICVSPLFGTVSADRLVEFMELTRLLGAQQVFLYDYHISDDISKVLRYYQDKKWVTVLAWKLPKAMIEDKIWYHGQLVSNNDCLYRTMALSAFTAFHDIDEFIVPHVPGNRTWNDLFPPVFPNDTCGYAFRSAFFDPSSVSGSARDARLQTPTRLLRTAMVSKVRTKTMVDPRRVFEIGIHHVSKQLREQWEPRPYDSSAAVLHHYRKCIQDFGMRCRSGGIVNDTTLRDHFGTELRENFDKAVRDLGL